MVKKTAGDSSVALGFFKGVYFLILSKINCPVAELLLIG
jgi:hypothetical protein